MNSKKAFTLIELLVVISIIAVLMAIMMPALGKVRQQAVGLIGRTQLKDMGTMVNLYMAENDGRMVSNCYEPMSNGTGRWTVRLAAYYERNDSSAGDHNRYNTDIFYCPIEWKKRLKNPEVQGEEGVFSEPDRGFYYQINSYITDNGRINNSEKTLLRAKFGKSDQWKDPATLPMFHDTNSTADFAPLPQWPLDAPMYPNQTLLQYGWDPAASRSPKINRFGPAANHGRGINYLFADGHADMTMWPYADTIDAPEDADYYNKYWHPLRNTKIATYERVNVN
ncbi:MAG: prepilin-type N-terminal cleavage/methylation domain-containing protein [Sedimentisphaeraceae bacterium JB056]